MFDISCLLDGADDLLDLPHGLPADLAAHSAPPVQHRRGASCNVPQRSSADEDIIMQVRSRLTFITLKL